VRLTKKNLTWLFRIEQVFARFSARVSHSALNAIDGRSVKRTLSEQYFVSFDRHPASWPRYEMIKSVMD